MMVITKKVLNIFRAIAVVLITLCLLLIIWDVINAEKAYFPKRSIPFLAYLIALIFATKYRVALLTLLVISIGGVILYFTPNHKASIAWYVYTSWLDDSIEGSAQHLINLILYTLPLALHFLLSVNIILILLWSKKDDNPPTKPKIILKLQRVVETIPNNRSSIQDFDTE